MSNVLENLSPMLREVNGVLSLCIDGSALSEIHRCPKASYYKLLRKRVSSKEDKSLPFGRVCAVAWDWRYRWHGNKPVQPCDQHIQDAVIDRAYEEMEGIVTLAEDAVRIDGTVIPKGTKLRRRQA